MRHYSTVEGRVAGWKLVATCYHQGGGRGMGGAELQECGGIAQAWIADLTLYPSIPVYQ